MQQLAWWREKAIYEENTMLNSSFRKGKKEGYGKPDRGKPERTGQSAEYHEWA